MRFREVQRPCRTAWRLRRLAVVVAVASGLLPALAPFATAQSGSLGRGVRLHDGAGVRTLTDPRAVSAVAEDSACCYGIMGAIKQPGAYRTGNRELKLTDLVQAAAGLTDTTSMRAQVIRHGRPGLQFVYSPHSLDVLQPGDVVVFDSLAGHEAPGEAAVRVAGHDQSASRSAATAPTTIDVAFVGLSPEMPVIVPLDTRVATVPQVLAALHQPPQLIHGVQVIRTSRVASRVLPGQLPESLADGDVIVFPAALVNTASLEQADPLPSPRPLRQPSVGLVADMLSESLSGPSGAQAQTAQSTGEVRPNSGSGDGATMSEPARSFEVPALPPLEVEPTPTLAAPEVEATPLDAPAASIDLIPPQFPPPTRTVILPTSLIERDQPARNLVSVDVTPQPSLARPSPASRNPHDDFAADSSYRLAMTVDSSASRGIDRAAEPAREFLAEVPVPHDAETANGSAGLVSRTTALGLTVLAIAAVCFAASLVWSRLDDATGLGRAEASAELHESRDIQRIRERPSLDRLIDNSLPLIEEQTVLPDHLDYHGEAVGRRRLRIDAHHELVGPHSRKTSVPREPQAAQATDDVTAWETTAHTGNPATASTSGQSATSGKQSLRLDTPVEPSMSSRELEEVRVTADSSRGLLERVLVAMEREKQR